MERTNRLGSGISIGHPIGCTGARILVTLMGQMVREGHDLGLASLCNRRRTGDGDDFGARSGVNADFFRPGKSSMKNQGEYGWKRRKKTETDPAAWMSAWTKSTTDFWRLMLGAQAGAGPDTSGKNPASQAQKMLLSAGKMIHLMLAKMSDPESINATLQGMETLPEISMNMIQQGVNSYVEMQTAVDGAGVKNRQAHGSLQIRGASTRISSRRGRRPTKRSSRNFSTSRPWG